MIRNEAPKYKKDEEKKIFKLKSTAEAQRLRLDRLMSDPVGDMLNACGVISSETVQETLEDLQSTSQADGEKPHARLKKEVVISDSSKDRGPKAPPEFIRNIWGSSAGVGSGDFHIYRGIRRREYARQKYNQFIKDKEEKDRKFHEKIQKNMEASEAKTAKKRAKRLKQKERLKRKRQQKKQQESDSDSSTSSSSDVDQPNDNEKTSGDEKPSSTENSRQGPQDGSDASADQNSDKKNE